MSFDSPAGIALRRTTPPDWKVLALSEVTDFQEGPGILAKDLHPVGVPLLRLRNIETPLVRLEGCNFLAPEKVAKKWAHFALRDGDLLISTSASLGRVSVVGSDAVGAVAYTGIIRFRSSSPKLDHKYLRAFLSSAAFVQQAEQMATGSVIKHFGPTHLRQMAITVPSLREQSQIAGIFDALDNRITLLRETNATLEAIAQALFPDGFEESELGLVPRGWRVGSFSDMCTISSGKRPPDRSDTASNECLIPLYGGAGVMGYTSASLFDVPKVVTGRVGTLGKVHIAYPPFWASDNVLVVTPNDKSFFTLVLNWLRSIDVLALNRGSTQPLLTQRDLGAQRGVTPPSSVTAVFEEVVAPLYQRIREQELQAQTLASLRDTLLPRLISGQLRLPEVPSTC